MTVQEAFSQDEQQYFIHVEVCVKEDSTASLDALKMQVRGVLKSLNKLILCPSNITSLVKIPVVHSVMLYDDSVCEIHYINLSKVSSFNIHIYELNLESALDVRADETADPQDQITTFTEDIVPSKAFDGLWESLVFKDGTPEKLLKYISATLKLSDRSVSEKIISYNRVILLHGEPGSGKTTLCKALAQKLAIRFGERYSYGKFIEINAHSLFSKWFSESGKLVMKMFECIKKSLADPQAFVTVLIDEVESLAAVRNSGSEPSDALRVVNALLTQLDGIKSYPNVLIMATSNLSHSIDLAFIDRADIKLHIGKPCHEAIYQILRSAVIELARTGIISLGGQTIMDLYEIQVFLKYNDKPVRQSVESSIQLWNISISATGLSGRTLRKLPVLTIANCPSEAPISIEDYLNQLHKQTTMEFQQRKHFE